ncbi:OmpA family protein [Szabonella alba]|uniref:OmpA family protein n=1 Tax=Szabonella alba TaxID=2804194 RepID=A0A8K0Y267_9RHOB|nr:OmpA family protein [Szabonella alba]MBL4919083.1 OmpA family protein [Szabonella alba]
MLKQSLIALSLAALLSLPQASLVHAQDGAADSAQELQEKFQRQKTRGLALVSNSSAQVVVPSTSAEGKTEIAPVTYSQIEKEEQVNIRITFDFDSSVLRPDEKPKLATLCEAMKAVDVELFRIVGHTDASGSDTYNEKLSLLRAEEVKRHLVNDCGIVPARLEAVGMGKRFLYNAEDPRADENRRVEFQALS